SQETEGHGLESQETRCRSYADTKGYKIAAVFPDTITGGGDFMKRPGMVALLSFLDAQPDESFVVIFDDLKRFARDTRFHLDLRDAFRKRGAIIECLNFSFDESPESEFVETIMAAQGQLERKQNGRQVVQKMKARMQSGYYTFSAPFGYRYDKTRGHGKMLVRDEPKASIVQEALEGYANGRFTNQVDIRNFLNTKPEFPKGKNGVVRQQEVTRLLNREVYCGLISYAPWGISKIKGHHEPIISAETFWRIQERRQHRAIAPARKNIGDDFALRGVAVCNDCGAPLRSCWSKGKTKRHPYYLCQTKSCKSYGKSIRRDKLEGDVGELLHQLEPSPGLFAMAKAMFRTAWDMRAAQVAQEAKTVQKQIAEAQKQIDALLDRIVESDSPTVIKAYEKKIDTLETEKILLEENQANPSRSTRDFDAALELSLMFLSKPWKLWESGNIAIRRTVLKLVFADRV
ncbi:recombinase family protein, partial [Epibacterium ulvae]|uniref:recombinase family protein n=1 Tax=Epibacterium ulvae TaxID=1156985 RepID=UPI002491EA46